MNCPDCGGWPCHTTCPSLYRPMSIRPPMVDPHDDGATPHGSTVDAGLLAFDADDSTTGTH